VTARQESGRTQTQLTYLEGAVRAYAVRLARVDAVRHPGRYASVKAMLDKAKAELAEARAFVETTR
jgi:hypothetical protein